MKPMHQVAAAGAVCLLLAGALWALNYTFEITGNWSEDGNWSGSGIPDADDNARIEKDKTVTVDAEDRKVMELWLEDEADVDLDNGLCASVRLFVYRDSEVSGDVIIDGGNAAGTRTLCAGTVRLAETVTLTLVNSAALTTPADCVACE